MIHSTATRRMAPLLLAVGLAVSLLAGSAGLPQRSLAAASPIGGYVEAVAEVALAVEPSGRVHALWTGRLNPHFDLFAFYASSPDGVSWTPYTVLHYYDAYDPQIALDAARGRAHLVYRSNGDGIIHHTVEAGVVSPPRVIDQGMVLRPQLAVDGSSGQAQLIWQQGALVKTSADSYSYHLSVKAATWDGTNWSMQPRLINSRDTWEPAIAAAPGGRTLLVWFQEWSSALGGPTDPGRPIVARSAFGERPGALTLRQAVSPYYPLPEKDDSILLSYSGGDGKFYLTSRHLMWPGHSRVYRYIWDGKVWSAPLDVAGNTAGWGVPRFIGAAADRQMVLYVYQADETLWVRTESGGALGAPQNLDRLLADRGYGAPHAFFVDRSGALHMVAGRPGAAGVYYLR
jgi:hypothetical protein